MAVRESPHFLMYVKVELACRDESEKRRTKEQAGLPATDRQQESDEDAWLLSASRPLPASMLQREQHRLSPNLALSYLACQLIGNPLSRLDVRRVLACDRYQHAGAIEETSARG
eukprot:760631-Hanusia_phi.AAC.1